MAVKIMNAFFGLISIIMAIAVVYGFYQILLTFANGQPNNEMKMIAYAGIVIMLIFLVFIGPISNFISDDQGNA